MLHVNLPCLIEAVHTHRHTGDRDKEAIKAAQIIARWTKFDKVKKKLTSSQVGA